MLDLQELIARARAEISATESLEALDSVRVALLFAISAYQGIR